MPAPFTVRKMRWKDLGRILEIERASFGPDAYDRNLFADRLRSSRDLFLAAERGRRVCGYLMACVRGTRAELVSIAVDPPARGQGAASALIESALRRLKRRRVARFSLIVKTSNREAQACYVKYGFRRLRRVPRYYEDASDGWLMTRISEPPSEPRT
jgi:ribosomal-protein-alanine N-acetyltransferase